MAIATAMAIVFRSCCNSDGATETPAIDESIAMAPGQGHRGTGAQEQGQQQLQLQWQWQWGNGNDRSCFISQRKTSTIVVVKNVQNVWLTIIPDVLCCD
jgi:hypothetical protein